MCEGERERERSTVLGTDDVDSINNMLNNNLEVNSVCVCDIYIERERVFLKKTRFDCVKERKNIQTVRVCVSDRKINESDFLKVYLENSNRQPKPSRENLERERIFLANIHPIGSRQLRTTQI